MTILMPIENSILSFLAAKNMVLYSKISDTVEFDNESQSSIITSSGSLPVS